MNWLDFTREFRDVAEGRLSSGPYQELELEDLPGHTPTVKNVRIIQKEIPGIFRVQKNYGNQSSFRYFQDGVQKTCLWKYYDYQGLKVPIFLHFSGSVVMERIKPDSFSPIIQNFRSSILVPEFLFEQFQNIQDIRTTGAKNPFDVKNIKKMALDRSRLLRQETELETINRFRSQFNKRSKPLLLKDGNILGQVSCPNIVGVVKTHNVLYIQKEYPQLQKMVWRMDMYFRSSQFSMEQTHGNKASSGNRVSSFYLRTQEPISPENGLLRVEFTSILDPDELSSSLIAESRIISSCSRWDRQLYPIQVCEDYLKAIMPKSGHLRSVMEVW